MHGMDASDKLGKRLACSMSVKGVRNTYWRGSRARERGKTFCWLVMEVLESVII